MHQKIYVLFIMGSLSFVKRTYSMDDSISKHVNSTAKRALVKCISIKDKIERAKYINEFREIESIIMNLQSYADIWVHSHIAGVGPDEVDEEGRMRIIIGRYQKYKLNIAEKDLRCSEIAEATESK